MLTTIRINHPVDEIASKINPLPVTLIIGSLNSAANKDMM